jgi:hypothetical protein
VDLDQLKIMLACDSAFRILGSLSTTIGIFFLDILGIADLIKLKKCSSKWNDHFVPP